MSLVPRRLLIAVAAGLLVAAGSVGLRLPSARADAPQWRVEQPSPPGGGVPGPLGAPSALRFIAPNRGLLQVGGSGGNPAGLWTYDGARWTELSTVCGSDPTGEFGAVAIAGRDDFWTVSDPAPNPLTAATPEAYGNTPDTGTTLCHFQGGRVIASYALAPSDPDAYLSMRAATCLSATDCWFGGIAGASPSGAEAGAFHLHWDGSALTADWSGQDRAVSSLTTYGATVVQTSDLGQFPFYLNPAHPAVPDSGYDAPVVQVLHDGQFTDDPYRTPQSTPLSADTASTLTPDSSQQEVDALDSAASSDGNVLWVAGAGAESGDVWGDQSAGYPNGAWSLHDPFLAVRTGSGPLVALRFSDADRHRWMLGAPRDGGGQAMFGSVAPIPGSDDEAWVAFMRRPLPEVSLSTINGRYQSEDPRLLRVRFDPDAPAGQPNVAVVQDVVPSGAAGLGAVRRVACPAATNCWAATTNGWLLHLSDGVPLPVDADPAYGQLIAIRPPDGRSPQAVATGDPFDDSDANRPSPPIVVVPPPPATAPTAPAKVHRLGPLIAHVRELAEGRDRVELRFELARPARIGLQGLLHGRVVARTRARALVPGDQRLSMSLAGGFRPAQIAFTQHELAPHAATLRTSARRSGSRGLRVTVRAPGAGTVRVRVDRDGGGSRTVLGRTVAVRANAPAARTLSLPAAAAGNALVVHFGFVAVGHAPAGVPRHLAAQRLLAGRR